MSRVCISAEEGSGCDVAQCSRSTKQQQLVLGGMGWGGGGSSLLLRSTSCQDVDTVPPPPPSAEFDPWADVLLRRSSMGAHLSGCVAVLLHSTMSACKLASPLASLVAWCWCSEKPNPPWPCRQWVISQKLPCLWGCGWNLSALEPNISRWACRTFKEEASTSTRSACPRLHVSRLSLASRRNVLLRHPPCTT